MVVNSTHDGHHALVVAIVRDIVERTQVEFVVNAMPEMVGGFVRAPSHHIQLDMLNQWIRGVLDVLLHCVEDELGVSLLLNSEFAMRDPLVGLV